MEEEEVGKRKGCCAQFVLGNLVVDDGSPRSIGCPKNERSPHLPHSCHQHHHEQTSTWNVIDDLVYLLARRILDRQMLRNRALLVWKPPVHRHIVLFFFGAGKQISNNWLEIPRR
jgi:hypothetical protein